MFIVLEGLDGAGKSTQLTRVRKFFSRRGTECEYLHFPRYDAPVFGELISRFLRGEFGDAASVDPYIVALLYAGDRNDAAADIRRWIAQGKAVLTDRYLYSNIGYQCAKVADAEARARLRDWIFDLEYNYYGIPRPDMSLFLDVPFAFTSSRLTTRREGGDRSYLHGATDIHEASLDLQRRVREVYLDAARIYDDLCVVDCADADGAMASPDTIAARIEAVLTRIVK